MENTSHDIYIDLPTRPNGTVVDGPLEFTGSDEVGTFAIVNGQFEFTPAPGHVGAAKFHLRHVPVVETRSVGTVAELEELDHEVPGMPEYTGLFDNQSRDGNTCITDQQSR